MDLDYGLGAEPADKEKTININFKDLEKRQVQATDAPAVAGAPAADYQAGSQGLGFGTNKVERDINDARTFLQIMFLILIIDLSPFNDLSIEPGEATIVLERPCPRTSWSSRIECSAWS